MNFHISTLFIKQHCTPRPPLAAFVRLGEFPYAYGHLCIEPYFKSCFGKTVYSARTRVYPIATFCDDFVTFCPRSRPPLVSIKGTLRLFFGGK